MISNSLDKPERLWKAIKKVLPGKSKESTTMLQDELGTYSNPTDIANCFNRFFSTIGSKLAENFPKGVQITNPYPNFDKSFTFKPIKTSFVLKQLLTIKSSKATGLDNINSRLLKDAAEIVAQPLTNIMNRSLKTGMVPYSWKEARVSPIFKSDSPINPSNFRPISILPVCMKLFERAVQNQLVSYLTDNNILCKEQSGFRKLHSTQTALLDITDYIYTNMDKGNLTGAVYIDLKKAFDCVDSETLLFKLECLGIKGNELEWFKNYLNNRRQCVQYEVKLSEKQHIAYGVPQGSILGPILFILYVNDIISSVNSSKILLYADDTVLLFSGKSVNDIINVFD